MQFFVFIASNVSARSIYWGRIVRRQEAVGEWVCHLGTLKFKLAVTFKLKLKKKKILGSALKL